MSASLPVQQRRRLGGFVPLLLGGLVVALPLTSGAHAVEVVVVNLDDPDEGFNDPEPRAPVGGNSGTTLGQQRLNAFQFAADQWGERLVSSVIIRVEANMDPLPCSSTSGVLGAAGTTFVFRDFPGAAFSNTWYHSSLADRLAGSELNPGENDIGSVFNSDLDDDPNCLGPVTWYYGFDEAPAGTISFVETVLHEIGHGVGVSTFVDLETGERLLDFDDIYMKFLEDHDSTLLWPNMNNAQRADSATDTGDLHWLGPAVAGGSSILVGGTVGTHVRMYAPDPLELGSSVSHWDTVLEGTGPGDDELMEPFATPSQAMLVTDEMLEDEGWNAFGGTSCAPASPPANLTLTNETISGTEEFEACDTLTAETNVVVTGTGDATFRSGRLIVLNDGFSVQAGGAFTATIDPVAFE